MAKTHHSNDTAPAIAEHASAVDELPVLRRPATYFWAVLVFSTFTSIAASVTHALLNARGGSVVLLCVAGVIAVTPPVGMLLATHGVGLLARAGRSALVQLRALIAIAIAITIDALAFRLNFDSLRSLAITGGIRPDIAWIWPIVIDLGIAQATMALLTLHHPNPARARRAVQLESEPSMPFAEPHHVAELAPKQPIDERIEDAGNALEGELAHHTDEVTPPGNIQDINTFHRHGAPSPAHLAALKEDPEPVVADGWVDVAETLIREKVTVKSVDETAEVLRLWDRGVATTTIASQTRVHRDTVANIIRAAESLLSTASRRRA